jgi:hypothetical protein
LPHFQLDVCNHPELKGLSSLADLTSGLVKLDKDSSYYLVVYIERELTAMISSDDIIKAYDLANTHRAKFKITEM